jgi:ABC-type multidrug transport system ATPase subunit
MAALVFRDVRYCVAVKGGGAPLQVLDGVSGAARAGRLCAVLGGSGSGKTSLLDVIAQRKETGEWSGRVELDGREVTGPEWRRAVGYVTQQDRLLSSSTVHEVLAFSALMRTPHKSAAEVEARIAGVLSELSLAHRRDARIGNEAARSLSGGELRRVSIAQELVADAQLLLLDEPTSGLDSSSAFDVVELLRELALRGRIVLATLHQPSSKMCELFGDLIVMGRGRVCFSGEWAQLVPHLQGLGFEVPHYYSPAEVMLDLTMTEESLRRLWASPEPHPASTIKQEQPPPLPLSASSSLASFPSSASPPSFAVQTQAQAPLALQCRLLWLRSFQQFIRNELLLVSEICQYIMLGLLIAFIYGKFPETLAQGSFDRISCIFFVLTTIVFVPSFTQVTISAEDFPLLKKESAAGWYSVLSHTVSKIATVWPFEFLLMMLFVICFYFICGFQLTWSCFWTFCLISCESALLCLPACLPACRLISSFRPLPLTDALARSPAALRFRRQTSFCSSRRRSGSSARAPRRPPRLASSC